MSGGGRKDRPPAPIVNNPFVGLTAEEARAECGRILHEFREGLPTRPALPWEWEETTCSRMYTQRSCAIIEAVEDDARRALEEAGHDPEATFTGGVGWA